MAILDISKMKAKKAPSDSPAAEPPKEEAPAAPVPPEKPAEAPAEPPKEEVPAAEPVKEEAPAEPVKEEAPAEPVKEEAPAEPVKEEAPAAEPADKSMPTPESVESGKEHAPDELPEVGKADISLFHPRGKEDLAESPKEEPKKETPEPKAAEDKPSPEEPKKEEVVSEPVKDEEPKKEEVVAEPVKEEPKKEEVVAEPVKDEESKKEEVVAEPVKEEPKKEDKVVKPKVAEPMNEPEVKPLSSESEKRLLTEENIIELYARGYNEKEIEHLSGMDYGEVISIISERGSLGLKYKHWLNTHYGSFNFSLGIIAVVLAVALSFAIPMMMDIYKDKTSTEMYVNEIFESQFLFGEGAGYYFNGEYMRAIEKFDEALRSQPENIKLLSFKGDSYYALEKWSEAQSIYESIVAIDDLNKEAYVKVSKTLFKQEMYGEALDTIDAALEIDDKYEYANFHRCPILEKLGKFDEAKECFFFHSREVMEDDN